jgi:hypothetical protein
MDSTFDSALDTLIVDPRIEGLGDLLMKVLVGRARTIARLRAA